MPATVTVNVQVNENGARATLQGIDDLVNKLNGKKVKIAVDVPTQQLNQINNVASGLTGTGTAALNAASAITAYGNQVKSSVTTVDGVVTRETAKFKKDAQTVIDVTRKIGKEADTLTVKTTTDNEAIRKSGEKLWNDQQKLYAAQFAAFDKKEKRTAALRAEVEKQEKAQAEATAKAAKVEQEAADRRLATYGRIAKVAATAFVIKETKEALSTMKDVDQELANIQKVTDETDAVIKKLGETAYDTASKYGVTATEYLTAAAEFAKAGYSNYADLSELAVKTRLVGDVSADTAAKFLLSADAAYKMGGNVDKLSTVLDRANVIENNYATSIYKLAEGLPIVASTASMANMSIDELMAGIGTITAVTQETGRKAGTALRALILNIEGAIGTVIDEDMTITQESVNSMTDALKKYGNEAVKAAQKTGQLVDPMEAIKSLAEAYKRGDLTDQGLFDILSSLGGKLRTNQLTALVKNFDMFSEMLDKVKDSAGSADKEIETMLKTWNAKLEQLENTWTKFVSHVLDSETIKGGIDLLKNSLNGLDNILSTDIGGATAKALALSAAFLEVSKIVDTIKKSSFGQAIIKQITATMGSVTGLQAAVEALKITFTTLNAVSLATLAGELMMLFDIVNKRGNINDDRFMHFYGQSTADTSKFGETLFGVLESNAGNAQAQLSAVTELINKYTGVYTQLKEALDNGARPEDFEAEFGFSVTKFMQDFEKAQNAVNNLNRILDNTKEETEDITEAFEGISESIDGATKALEAFSNATQTSKSAASDAYRNAYQQFLADYKGGKTDSNVVRAAADLLLPPEVQKALGYDLQAMGKVLASDLYKGIYNGASGNAGVDFVNYMAENMTKSLDKIVNITKNKNGTYDFEYASVEKLADYFNLPIPAIQALINSLDEFGVHANMGWEEADNLAKSLGLVGENAVKSKSGIKDVVKSLTEKGFTDPVEIRKALDALEGGGYLDLSKFSSKKIGQMISEALEEVKTATEGAEKPKIEVDTSQVEEAKEAIKEIPDTQDKTVNINVTGLEKIDSFKTWLETSPGTYQVIVNDDGSITVVAGEAADLSDYLTGLGEGAYAVSVNDDGSITIVKTDAENAETALTELENPFLVTVGDDGTISAVIKNGEDLESSLSAMGEGPYVVSVNDDGSINAVKADADNLETVLSETENPVTVTVGDDGSIESVEGKADDLKTVLTEIDGLPGSTYTITINDPDNAEEYKTTLEEIDGTYDVKVNEDGSVTAKSKAENLQKVLSQIEGDTPVTVSADVTGTDDVKALADQEDRVESKGVTVTAKQEGKDAIQGLADVWHGIQSKTVTLRAVFSTAGNIASNMQNAASDLLGYINSGNASAEGTKNAPGGPTLVNELGPELISDNGRAYIANGGKPAIVNLGKGAIVLTAEETRQALGNATVNNGIDAYAKGNALIVADKLSGGVSRDVVVFSSGNSGTGATGIPANAKKTSGWQEYWEDPNKKKNDGDSTPSKPSINWEEKEKKLKEELEALEDLAEWYHNQKNHEKEAETYQKAIEKVDALRNKYISAGFKETAKEVVTLANKIYDYEEDVADAKAHAIEDLEDELDNLESQIELAENQGDLQRMLELQGEAQKKVAELIEAYRAAGFGETSPEILKLANMGFDYASDSGSTMKDLWKNLIEALEDMKDTQDEANDLAEKQLAVDEAREALQNAQNQRTVRVFNPITGQWEWVADSKSIQQAEESLKSAEEALLQEQQSQELSALKKAMENGASLEGVTIGPGLSALLSGASLEQTNAFASALGVLSGGLATTADTSAKSIFDSVDSHDTVTQYTFNGVTIDAATAENTTLAELTRMITPLALTTNMPA